jgi:Holliday junction DNA helicase RuvB
MRLIGLTNLRYELDSLKELPHILFLGPRGTGKTTLSEYVATSHNRKLILTVGKTLKAQDLLNILININENDVLLIDEIHRLNPGTEELLYHPMEKFQLPIKNLYGSFQTFPLPKFCLIGTTTKPSLLSKPLISRFQLQMDIPHYNVRELARIIQSNYNFLSQREALSIAVNTITPREAVNLASRITNFGNKNISEVLEFIGYKYGLSQSERYYLKIVHEVNTISLTSLGNALQIDKDEVSFIEDKLIRKGYIDITTKGRQLTIKGILKIKQLKQ